MPLQGQVKSWLAHLFGSAYFVEYDVKEKCGESAYKHEGRQAQQWILIDNVNIVVHNRKQIAEVIRNLRMHFGFPRIARLAQPVNTIETSIAS